MLVGMVLLLSWGTMACSNQSLNTEEDSDVIHVVTTIAQIANPISEIGAEHVKVTSLMGSGVDPHLYQATTGDISKLDKGDVIFYSGLHLEANMIKVFDQMSKAKPVVAIGESIAEDELLRDIKGAIDPHIWFDIDLWKQALTAATDQLIEMKPQYKEDFLANKEQYFAKLDSLKQKSVSKLSEIPQDQRILVTAHDAFGYFGRMNDIKVIGLQGLSTEAEIGLTDIEETIDILMEHKVPAVFIESSINPASIQAVIEGAQKNGIDVQLGGSLYSDAMGAEGTDEGTYIGMYEHNVTTIYEALMGKGE
ncbi:metal ABC transporter solute-binding protein, Zn/Mn family [Paenibacillus endoradicis]|uniref:metal ABC transporter solute-binding protein, Zn/Mn family n=1 Tax=Paenibacillus endoradicis TaxID=2972487 RepID=UPI00358E9AE7